MFLWCPCVCVCVGERGFDSSNAVHNMAKSGEFMCSVILCLHRDFYYSLEVGGD